MSNELQIFETEELTTTEKTELGRNIDRLIYTHKNNRQEINRLVFASVAAMTDADRDQADLKQPSCFSDRQFFILHGSTSIFHHEAVAFIALLKIDLENLQDRF